MILIAIMFIIYAIALLLFIYCHDVRLRGTFRERRYSKRYRKALNSPLNKIITIYKTNNNHTIEAKRMITPEEIADSGNKWYDRFDI